MNRKEAQFQLTMILPYVAFLRHKTDTIPSGSSLCYKGEPLAQHGNVWNSKIDRTKKQVERLMDDGWDETTEPVDDPY